MKITGMHIGRSWAGTRLEDECPCGKAPCGLVDSGLTSEECAEHPIERAKSLRQGHRAEDCPDHRPAQGDPVNCICNDQHHDTMTALWHNAYCRWYDHRDRGHEFRAAAWGWIADRLVWVGDRIGWGQA